MKKKHRIRWGKSPANLLLKAAFNYIREIGGTAIVIGGIEIQRWPEANEGNYKLAINVTGRIPKK